MEATSKAPDCRPRKATRLREKTSCAVREDGAAKPSRSDCDFIKLICLILHDAIVNVLIFLFIQGEFCTPDIGRLNGGSGHNKDRDKASQTRFRQGSVYLSDMSEFIRALQLPPAGRPRWQPPAAATYDLLYLAWGRRSYGRHPIQTTLGIGWEYLLLVQGSPTFSLGQRTKKLQPGTFVIIPPDCPSGLSDHPDGKCEVLGWIWRTPPRPGLVGQGMEAPSFFKPHASFGKPLNQLHLRCRHEIASPNSTTPFALEILHAQLDLALMRASAKAFATDSEARIELALRWIDQHLNERRPVSSLCAYLQVSVATLNRLFREHIGTTPHTYILKTKLNVARMRIAQGCSVKETSFFLGYRHANELSRALKTASAAA